MIKYGSLCYRTANLGDYIQSLATEQFLPRVDKRFVRDMLGQVKEQERFVLIMNGWFTHRPENWPPSDSILPIFIGFHLADQPKIVERLLSDASIAYFKKHQPIGCRDRKTQQMLVDRGVEAFFSKCATLTFPTRSSTPKNGKVFLVDADDIVPPRIIAEQAVRVTHKVHSFYSDMVKFEMAKELLAKYRDEARLVITTRLHCALPCLAMGIPVVYFGDQRSSRVALLTDLGLQIHPPTRPFLRELYRAMFKLESWARAKNHFMLSRVFKVCVEFARYLAVNHTANWSPDVLPIEDKKRALTDLISGKLAEVMKLSNPDSDR